MATYEETGRGGRQICAMRHPGRVATDLFPRVLTRQAEEKPMVANQLGRAPRRQCLHGYFSGGADRPYGEETNERETSERSTVSGESSREFARWTSPARAERRPRAEK